MPFDRFFIGPINSGLQTDVRPFYIPEDAFTKLKNSYVFRGRVKKRFGSFLMGAPQSQLTSRLRINLGNNTNAAMNLPANTTAHTPQLAIGQMFSLGTDVFIVYQLGMNVATLTTSSTVTASIDSTATPNTVTFTAGAASPVFWYPSLPVMGITQYLTGDVNDHPTIAFDTEFAYQWNSGWARLGTAVWKGSNSNYFYSSNWQSVTGTQLLFTTNFNFTTGAGTPAATDDPIQYWNGTTWTALSGNGGANGIYFNPGAGGVRVNGPFVQTALIVLAFKNRLILLNTAENNGGTTTQFPQRCRFSLNGDPTALNAWYEPNTFDAAGNTAGGAGFIDAYTEEKIIAAEFIKDRLIVYFERSTWELAYTGSEVLPFVWQKINTELGAMSTFSSIPFDKEVLGIGQTGIHSCSGANVLRIDNKIPSFVFDTISNLSVNAARIAGIRDYFQEMVYWTFVNTDYNSTNQNFGTNILVYNYKNNSWAVNDDCITTFGYFEQATDTTWASSDPEIWANWNDTWESNAVEANKRQILAGTPEGFTLVIDENESRNAPSMQITNINFATGAITVINHNFYDGDYALFENIVGDANAMSLNGQIFIVFVIDANTISVINGSVTWPATGTYKGGGTLARVSRVEIQSKWFNPYLNQDRNFYLHKIDFGVDRTNAGEIEIDYYASTATLSMVTEAEATGSILGTSILETSPYAATFAPLEQYQQILWHPVYLQVSAQIIQLDINLNPRQMLNPNIALADFVLHGLILYTSPSATRLQ